MGYDMKAELNYCDDLEKEKDRIIELIKKEGYTYNGICEDNDNEMEFEKEGFVMYISLS